MRLSDLINYFEEKDRLSSDKCNMFYGETFNVCIMYKWIILPFKVKKFLFLIMFF